MMGESLVEILSEIFGEIIFDKIILPIFRFLGACYKFPFLFKKYSFKEIIRRGNNATYGFVISFFLTLLIIYLIYA